MRRGQGSEIVLAHSALPQFGGRIGGRVCVEACDPLFWKNCMSKDNRLLWLGAGLVGLDES